MFRRFLILAIVAFVPSFAAAQTDTAGATKQIQAMEQAITAAMQKGDAAAFKANIADDAITLDATGLSPIAEFVKMFDQVKMTSFTIDQSKVMFVNDTTAIHTYRWTGKGMIMGQMMPSPSWSSTVWVKRGGKWQAVFHQETIGTEKPAPAKK
jgi:uncharacterized protein (TIGR02246 family)